LYFYILRKLFKPVKTFNYYLLFLSLKPTYYYRNYLKNS